MTKTQDEINAAVAANKPFIFKDNPLQALATKMHLPVDQVTHSIQTYNQYCDNGQDDDFATKV
ncbi:hypothetical protein WP50_31540 [Lactiplantibacillus plantarum]|nr:hypothetical protein WP50_31540 [Lactiplantibacillus plantarum]